MTIPQREAQLYSGEYYHPYNRGNNRERILVKRENYLFFLRRLRKYVVSALDIVAHCLMPTHYHLLVRFSATNLSPGSLEKLALS